MTQAPAWPSPAAWSMGGPPGIARLVIAVVDEPTTKLAGLTSGDLDFAGISPEIFDDVPSEQLTAAIIQMSRTLGLDPEEMLDEITARLKDCAANRADDRAEQTATKGAGR